MVIKQKIQGAAFDLLKGGAGTGVFIGASAIIGGPAWVGLIAGVAAGVAAHKGVESARKVANAVNWRDISDFASRYIQQQADAVLRRSQPGPREGFAPA